MVLVHIFVAIHPIRASLRTVIGSSHLTIACHAHITAPAPLGANAVSSSRTASELSFLIIHSASPLAVDVSLLSFRTFTPNLSASFSINPRRFDRTFRSHSALSQAVGSPVLVYMLYISSSSLLTALSSDSVYSGFASISSICDSLHSSHTFHSNSLLICIRAFLASLFLKYVGIALRDSSTAHLVFSAC